MHPANLDIEVYKGEDFHLSFIFKNPDGTLVDLTSCSVVSFFRHEQEKETPISLNATIDVPTATIFLSMDKEVSNTLRLGRGLYDVVLTDSHGESEVLLKGYMQIKYSPSVSLPD